MKLIEAINKVDALKPNTYSQMEKVGWLSNLDLLVKSQILDNCEGHPAPDFEGYTEDTSLETVLLVPAPYDVMYLRWLEAQIDYYNGENERYNDAIRLFEDLYGAYASHYRRNHRPCGAGNRFLF